MKVAISRNSKAVLHSTNWVFPWEDYCKENNIEYELIDLMRCDAVKELAKFDVLLWHFGQYRHAEMLETRSILYTAKRMGLKVFPDFNDAWHFDDKVAEMYILQALGAPIPDSTVYYDKETLKSDVENGLISFPIVGKLRTGSGSHNVKLLKSKRDLMRYASTMFSGGFNPAPSLLYKTTSNIRSSHNKAQFMSKLKRAPEFLRTLADARHFPYEKDYVYLQEFIPNDGYDMKVVVVGDKCAFLVRPIRSHDFRASGGGEVLFDKKFFKKQIIESAFKVTDELGSQCMGYDYVVNNQTGEGVIVEMSYGFSHQAIMASGGYYDRNLEWHDEPLNAPKELLKNLIKL
jgi:Glutathione synthase/Ribosomal protein S6 modification enzyme (glutaminyl transferase)